jgi:hypothetical protein
VARLFRFANFLERGNLILVQACQRYGAKVEETDAAFKREFAECDAVAGVVEGRVGSLPTVGELPEALDEATVAKGRGQDEAYEQVRERVERAFGNCFGTQSDMQPIAMLQRFEDVLETFYAHIDRIRPEFVAMKQAQRDKQRREKQRTDKQIAQEIEQKQKIEQAMYRATRPIHKRSGRALVPRMLPVTHQVTEDKEAIAAMREQKRIEELLFKEQIE